MMEELFKSIKDMYARSQASGIIVYDLKHSHLMDTYFKDIPIWVVKGKLLRRFGRRNLSNVRYVRPDNLNSEFLKDKIVVFIGDDTPRVSFRIYNQIAREALIAVYCSPKDMLSKEALKALKTWKKQFDVGLQKNMMFGITESASKTSNNSLLVAIGGSLVMPSLAKYPKLKVLAIISVFNEKDIILPVINHLINEGLDVHIIDNWSEDGSFEIIKEFSKSNSGVTFERFPAKNVGQHRFEKLLRHINKVAIGSNYDWVMHYDADEIRSSPWDNVSLRDAVSFIDSKGFNTIDFTVFDFRATKDGFKQGDNPTSFFTHGEFGTRPGHFIQLKLWKNSPHANLYESAGHSVKLPNQKVFPIKFFLGHYPYRSNKQSREKVFKYRKPRLIESEKVKGWNSHYDLVEADQSFIHSKKGLVNFAADEFPERYLIERISGYNIQRT